MGCNRKQMANCIRWSSQNCMGSKMTEEKEAESKVLHSHSWKAINSETYLKEPKFKVGVEIHRFKCSECGEEAFGSEFGPTVWATYVARSVEPLSCNDITVRDIIV